MGSYANSLHIKTVDANEVSDAIRRIMLNAGYQASEEEPADEAMAGMPSNVRAMHISDHHNGWSGVLDSDLGASVSLAAEISRSLDTHAIHFMVNDSDSWHYQLFRRGSQLDAFDSSGEVRPETDMKIIPPGLAQILAGGGVATMQRVQEQVRDLLRQTENDMPADIRELDEKIQRGAANRDETKRCEKWGQAQWKRLMDDLNRIMSGAIPSVAKPQVTKADLERHVKKLGSILPPEVSHSRLLRVLGKQAVFAESVLAEFLELVGIQPFFAHLSYHYLAECSESEFLGADIEWVGHLKFKCGET